MVRHIRLVVVITALSLAAGSAPRIMAAQESSDAQADGSGQAAGAVAEKASNDVYLVQMSDAPVVKATGALQVPGEVPTVIGAGQEMAGGV